MSKPIVIYRDLQVVSYKEAWDYQTDLHNKVKQRKLDNRGKEIQEKAIHYLLFCEHNPVYTLGKSGSKDNLLLSEAELEGGAFEFFRINRGGDITYHGPGQITGYPIFDLDSFFTDVHKYVRYLEEAVIRTIADYGIDGTRMEGKTGVWINAGDQSIQHRKICAIGVHLSRWVTMHGFALNVNTDLSHFRHIIPCGITDEDKTVTSIKNEIGHPVDMNKVKQTLKKHLAILFQFEYE